MPADRPKKPATETSPRWGLIADDLTGACDAAVQFALRGFGTTVSLRADGQPGSIAEMTALSTASRDEPAEAAGDKVEAACRWMSRHGITVLFKKIDSTLRGNVGAEIQTVMEACEFPKAVINPAFPAMGRALVGGRLYVHGVEPTPACHLPSMLPSDPRLQVADAATEEELSGIARMALDQDPPALLVGSAGLARAAAAIVGGRCGRPASAETPRGDQQPMVFVVGSVHEVTTAQVGHLLESCPAMEVEPGRLSSSHFEEAADSQASLVVRIPWDRFTEEALGGLVQAAEMGLLGGLLVTGGDTARLVCRAMRADAIQLRGEIAPGIPWGVIEGGTADGVQIVTKGGAFGAIDVAARVADRLSLRGVPHAG